MTKIYDQHAAAFKNVSAFVILKDGERVATIAFKFPKDGAGRLYAYVHWFGCAMVRGSATGYGYDKKSAACESATDKLFNAECGLDDDNHVILYKQFHKALRDISGSSFDRALDNAGFTVLQAV